MQVSKTCNGFGGMHGQSEKLCAARASCIAPNCVKSTGGPCRTAYRCFSTLKREFTRLHCTMCPFLLSRNARACSNLLLLPKRQRGDPANPFIFMQHRFCNAFHAHARSIKNAYICIPGVKANTRIIQLL